MNRAGGPSGDGHRADAEIRWAQQALAAAGVDTARTDAEWLLAAALGVDRGRLLIVDTVDDAARARFHDAVQRRARRVPLQHIIGTAPFGPVELEVGPGVFTPRPETEFLAEWAARSLEGSGPARVVDLCSGSGALAIAVATMAPTAQVTAVERSPDALMWLRRNVERTPPAVAERISVIAADVTDVDRMCAIIPDRSVDVVVSNPPYVPEGGVISPEVAHDPHEAVFAGDDGMSVITPMLVVIGRMLRPDGVVGIEHDETTAAAVLAGLGASGQFLDMLTRADLAGRPRFATARRAPDLSADPRGRMAG
ncbi:peptide chain release factor N(5)-glutamine methyltransferase [Gordonia sp. LSe1-13]|uniref:Release factor glutamine methyltransferase n=1 Tax=Gordonia sesuvii TaxID=3116777 RepID=A0ABU7M7N8_9ACTN|nr:peptide chain release factor N(5)-glutamine methyltransferase [Gordonia sp. LSe1-13]